MAYRAAVDFIDLQDENRLYKAGEKFPRDGLEVSAARLTELSTDANRMGYPLIAAAQDDKKPTRKRVKKHERDD